MLGGQRQRVDVSQPRWNCSRRPPAEKTGRGSLLDCVICLCLPPLPPFYPTTQPVEGLNCIEGGLTCAFQVPFTVTISTSEARGAVEKWLLQVQDVMLMSVRDVVEKAVAVSQQRTATYSTVQFFF